MPGRGGPTASYGFTPAQHSFAEIPRAEIQRSVFNRSCGLKTAFDSGFLVPIFCDEALPGDTFKLRTNSFARMTTPLFPVMDNIHMDFFFFAVPIRLIWDNFQKFCGEQENPGDSTDFLVPQFDEVTVAEGSLSDFMGLPLGSGLDFSSLWHRAYNLIYNEWFRDQNLQSSIVVDRGDGPDTLSDYVLRRRGKRHDYFTSALPFPQKGDPVLLPLGSSAPLVGTPTPTITGLTVVGTGIPTWQAGAGGARALTQTSGTPSVAWASNAGASGSVAWVDPQLDVGGSMTVSLAGVTADLSAATAATINQIREAFQVQRLLERDARGGSRYTEILRSHFGVTSPDARLQRPEYLGGGSTRINVHPVARTTPSDVISGGRGPAFADLGAFATSSIGGVGFMKSFTEHCVILGLVNVRTDLVYQQGINRMFSRRTRYDFYWPALAHLGEQAILNKEIFATGGAGDDLVFGYQERYADYRYKPSITTGRMRSTAAAPMDQWHLGQEFASLPLLNATFIEDNAPFARILAVNVEPQFFGDFFFEFRCARPMPTFSVPGLVDHF